MINGKKEYRSFAFIVGTIAAGIFGLLVPMAKGQTVNFWAIAIGLALALIGAVAPNLLAPVYRWWMKLGHILGIINTFILLHLIFFFFFSPLALLFRIGGRKTSASLKAEPKERSYRIASVRQEKERMKEIF